MPLLQEKLVDLARSTMAWFVLVHFLPLSRRLLGCSGALAHSAFTAHTLHSWFRLTEPSGSLQMDFHIVPIFSYWDGDTLEKLAHAVLYL